MSTLDNSSYGDAQHRTEQYNYTIKWGSIGFFGGAIGIGYPLVWLASRRYPAVKAAHPSVKFSFILTSACASGVIAADKAGIAYDRARYSDTGAALLARAQTREEQIWNGLTPTQKALTFMKNNKVSAVSTGWAGSIALITLYLQTTPLTGAQKLVQARVWGQGLTVAAIVGLAVLGQIPTPGDEIAELQKSDTQHSWIQTLEMDNPELKQQLEPEKVKQDPQQKNKLQEVNPKVETTKEEKPQDQKPKDETPHEEKSNEDKPSGEDK